MSELNHCVSEGRAVTLSELSHCVSEWTESLCMWVSWITVWVREELSLWVSELSHCEWTESRVSELNQCVREELSLWVSELSHCVSELSHCVSEGRTKSLCAWVSEWAESVWVTESSLQAAAPVATSNVRSRPQILSTLSRSPRKAVSLNIVAGYDTRTVITCHLLTTHLIAFFYFIQNFNYAVRLRRIQ
jgi:hypothetical protein